MIESRLHGSYEALDTGNLSDALADFTGGVSELIALEDENGLRKFETDEDKRRVRRTLRDLHDKLLHSKDGAAEDFNLILQEATQILKDVKGTQEAMEDAKMFRMLCQKVREMSEDTNTNEKKFHVDEFAANIGRFVNASTERGNNVRITRAQLVSLGKRLSNKFRRTPSFSVILGALDTEAPEEKEKRRIARRPVAEDHICSGRTEGSRQVVGGSCDPQGALQAMANWCPAPHEDGMAFVGSKLRPDRD